MVMGGVENAHQPFEMEFQALERIRVGSSISSTESHHDSSTDAQHSLMHHYSDPKDCAATRISDGPVKPKPTGEQSCIDLQLQAAPDLV